ncbi:hypothetical protein CLU83_1297 [Flavobacterium sp. 1]|nr:hypothetical protein CLU83_1297 [Flavobacterium sp. 1]
MILYGAGRFGFEAPHYQETISNLKSYILERCRDNKIWLEIIPRNYKNAFHKKLFFLLLFSSLSSP